jgi:hypothetical protein
VQIFDVSGRRVVSLLAPLPSASRLFEVRWDGRIENGGEAPPGVYFARIPGNGDAATRIVRVR